MCNPEDMMRLKEFLLAGSAICFVTTAYAADQTAPVEFATDPGAAHPKFSDQPLDTSAQEEELPVEVMMASDPGFPEEMVEATPGVFAEQAPSATMPEMQPATEIAEAKIIPVSDDAEAGDFDYGFASNEMELDEQPIRSATAGPTSLLEDEMVITPTTVATAAKPIDAPEESAPVVATVALEEPSSEPKIIQAVDVASEEPVLTQAVATSSALAPAEQTISVQQGDTVYGIARMYGIKAAQIIEANNMQAPYTLDLGQPLKIPAAGDAPIVQMVQYSGPAISAAPQKVEIATINQQQIYIVEPGNTLYSISRSFGMDVKSLAELNNIPAPYTISIGQKLVIPETGTKTISTAGMSTPSLSTESSIAKGAITPTPSTPKFQREASVETAEAPKTVSYNKGEPVGESRFSWPLQGKVVMGYGLGPDGRRNDGINIAAPVGSPIRAVEDGEVVYRGSELEGYGNLLLIRHSDGWVSAYAHADAMLVRKGEKIRKGQVVAKVGKTGTVGQPQLHFELRHDLKPTDPLAALEGRNPLAVQ